MCPHIFAIGDTVGNPMLNDKASHQGRVVAEAAAGVGLTEMDTSAEAGRSGWSPPLEGVGPDDRERERRGAHPPDC